MATDFMYMECDIPEGMTLDEYRRHIAHARMLERRRAYDRIKVRITAIFGAWSVAQLFVIHTNKRSYNRSKRGLIAR